MKSHSNLHQTLKELSLFRCGISPQVFEPFVRFVKFTLVEKLDCVLQVLLRFASQGNSPVHMPNLRARRKLGDLRSQRRTRFFTFYHAVFVCVSL